MFAILASVSPRPHLVSLRTVVRTNRTARPLTPLVRRVSRPFEYSILFEGYSCVATKHIKKSWSSPSKWNCRGNMDSECVGVRFAVRLQRATHWNHIREDWNILRFPGIIWNILKLSVIFCKILEFSVKLWKLRKIVVISDRYNIYNMIKIIVEFDI